MASQVHAIPRTMASIVMDLATTRQRIAVLHAQPEREGDGTDVLHAREHALECEFKATFEATTGVRWSVAQQVMS